MSKGHDFLQLYSEVAYQPAIYYTYIHNFVSLFLPFVAQNGKLKLENPKGEKEQFELDLKTVLFFATGLFFPPPAGFSKPPTIFFECASRYPRSNTCANSLYLPLIRPLLSFDEFAYIMAFSILNSAGFG